MTATAQNSTPFKSANAPVSESEVIKISGKEIKTTPVFYAYWKFASERQNIFYRRLARTNSALTDDPILQQYKFTNSYRASDRVSQYLIRNVIYREDLPDSNTEVFFRILLFKLFNKIETWELLENAIGPLTWANFNFDRYDKVLSAQMSIGERIYSAAYIMPSAGGAFGHRMKHQNHLRMIAHMINQKFPKLIEKSKSMSAVFQTLLTAPSIGPFLAYQFSTDLNYSSLTDFNEDDFVVAGPGALDGISKCFIGASKIEASDVIRYMRDNQAHHFSQQGIKFRSLWGRPLKLIDCQNIFCEISKYARIAFPEIGGVSGRTRIKQKFSCSGALPAPWYPPKWGINQQISLAPL